jgi:hypothetical protein
MHTFRLILVYHQTTFVTSIFFNKRDKGIVSPNFMLFVVIKGRYLTTQNGISKWIIWKQQ